MRESKVVTGLVVVVKRTAGYSNLEKGDVGKITEIRQWRGFTIVRVSIADKPNEMNWIRVSSIKKYREKSFISRLSNLKKYLYS